MSQIRTVLNGLFFIVLFILLSVEAANAQSSDGGSQNGPSSGSCCWYYQRAEKREATRWTLSEWLAQKDRNRLMDMWLSMHTPSPFEFSLGGGYLATTTKVDTPSSETTNNSFEGDLSAYAAMVGLTVEYHNETPENFNDLSGMLNIRLLGDSLQNSSLTISGGQRTRSYVYSGSPTSVRNTFEQVSLQIYLMKYFGIDGFYRGYNAGKNDPSGDTIGGNESQAGIFIDFKAVRVFGAWNRDVQSNSNTTAGTNSTTTRESIISGLKFYY